MTIVLLPLADTVPLTHYLIEPDGTVHALDGSEGILLETSSALGAPVVDLVAMPAPFRAGAVTRNVQFRARPVDLALHVEGISLAQVSQRLDALRYWLDPTRGEMRYRIARTDGAIRELWCRLSAGPAYEFHEGVGNWQEQQVSLLATDDPYVYELADVSQTFVAGTSTGFFDSPFLPVKLSGSTVVASPTLTNEGTAQAYPIWTITGPGSDPSIRNMLTGQVFTFAYTLALGEQIIIDTRDAGRRGDGVLPVRSSAGDNLYALLSEDYLFSLPVGSTPIQITMIGATVDSSIEVSWRTRWLGF